jgi:hypothetical protein
MFVLQFELILIIIGSVFEQLVDGLVSLLGIDFRGWLD